MIAPRYIAAAKRALRDRLRQHEDEGVRHLADTVELSDTDPRVLTIATGYQLIDGGGRG